jgi:D-3-phosphoglycerate dehydrogenase
MPEVLVVQSDSHPIEVETFTDTLGADWSVSELELPPGTLHVRADEELSAALSGMDAVFLRAGEMTEAVIESADTLRSIAVHGSGYDHIDLEAATNHGVVVTHTPEGPGPAVVEYVLSMMVLMLRQFPERLERTAGGEWSRHPGLELRGRTIGVVGLGYIGSRVARAVSETFGADVVGYDPYVSGELESEIWPRVDQKEIEAAGVELLEKAELFERSDLVTLHTPLTERTRGMVGSAELEALDGGYLINTARGDIVDETALLAALDAGSIERVALDVLSEEPPDSEHPLLDHPRAYVTPHIASATDGYPPRAARAAAEKIQTVLADGRPDTVVNPAVFGDDQ